MKPSFFDGPFKNANKHPSKNKKSGRKILYLGSPM
jgi:hypothetical protein